MKKTFLLFAIAFITLATISSCQKEEISPKSPEQEEIKCVYDINVKSETIVNGQSTQIVKSRTESYLSELEAQDICKRLTQTTTSNSNGVTVTINQTATYNICKGHTGGSKF